MNIYKHVTFEDMPGGILLRSMSDDEYETVLARVNRQKYARASKYRMAMYRAGNRRRNGEGTTVLMWLDDVKDIESKQNTIAKL